MADNFTCNIAKGRAVELYNRVVSNDPANSALVVVLLAAAPAATEEALKDADTLAAILALQAEATNTGYARKILTDADLPPLPAPDDAANARRLPLPNQTWTNVQGDGTGAIGRLVVAYDPDTTGGTDANIIPLSVHKFTANPAGNNVVTDVAALGFYDANETCP